MGVKVVEVAHRRVKRVVKMDANILNSENQMPVLGIKELESAGEDDYVGHVTFEFEAKELFFVNSK